MDKKFKNDWMNQYATRKGRREVKKLQHPSMRQLCLILVPWCLSMLVCLVIKRYPQWLEWFGMVSVGVMTIAVTYFCIRQKCYVELARALVALLGLAFVVFGSNFIFR